MSKFKISIPGVSVQDAKPSEETVDSTYPSPKVNTLATPPHAGIIFVDWSSSTQTQALGTTRVLYKIPHGYNYIPTVFGNYIFDNGTRKIRGMLPFQYGSLGMIILDTDKTNANLKYISLDLANTTPITPFLITVRFYIMAERGHD